jgi:phosphatidylglycerophosphate synthase
VIFIKLITVSIFPLIRQISLRVSPLLIRLPISANQVTTASFLAGGGACWYLAKGTYETTLVGALLFLLCYILDNSDGEVARAKNQCSEFGEKYDTFVDWVVHAGFFACLGWGVAQETGQNLWLWLGLFGAAGGSINYFIGIYMDSRFRRQLGKEYDSTGRSHHEAHPAPKEVKQWAVFILREMSRADFCFIVLFLALFDVTWFLLPTAAVGAHVYWMTQFFRGARDYHV